jgi:hypothetical protein
MWKIALLLVCIGLLMTQYYAISYGRTCIEFCGDLHRSIIDGTGVSPHRYRVLSSFAVEAIFHPQSNFDVWLGYIIMHDIALPAMLIAMYAWFRKWLTEMAALAGALLVAAYSPIMFDVYGISLNNPLEVIFMCIGLLWLLAKRDGVFFGALIALATLNRETGVLLVLAYAAVNLPRWRERRVQIKFVIYGAVWAAVYMGLRLWLGRAPDMITLQETVTANLSPGWVREQALINNSFLIPVWIAACLGIPRTPRALRRVALIGIPYLLLLIPFSLWNETRLLLPLFTLWLPLALIGFSPNALLPREASDMALDHRA